MATTPPFCVNVRDLVNVEDSDLIYMLAVPRKNIAADHVHEVLKLARPSAWARLAAAGMHAQASVLLLCTLALLCDARVTKRFDPKCVICFTSSGFLFLLRFSFELLPSMLPSCSQIHRRHEMKNLVVLIVSRSNLRSRISLAPPYSSVLCHVLTTVLCYFPRSRSLPSFRPSVPSPRSPLLAPLSTSPQPRCRCLRYDRGPGLHPPQPPALPLRPRRERTSSQRARAALDLHGDLQRRRPHQRQKRCGLRAELGARSGPILS